MSNLPENFLFSQSSLQAYVDCPRRFQLRYLQRQQYPAPEVDDMLEFERRMEQGQRFHQLVQQHLIGIPAPLLKKRLTDADVQRWFDLYLQTGLDDVPANRQTEHTLTVPLGDTMLLAKFDLLAQSDDKALIVDWKTARKLPRREWLADKLQTIVYRYVLAKSGIDPALIEMRYWYAEHNGTSHSFAYDAVQFKADEKYLMSLVDEINTRADFPLTDETSRCRFCTYRSLCERGVKAGSLAEWDAQDYDEGVADFTIDLEQIAEIAF